jgi:cell wall assembly regulator SMI1
MSFKITESSKSISEEDLNKAEKKISKKLPTEYRSFLLQHNGGRPADESSGFEIEWNDKSADECWSYDFSIIHFFNFITFDEDNLENTNLFECNDDHDGRIPHNTIPIGYDPGGNLILIGVGEENQGKIYFWLLEAERQSSDEPEYLNVGFVANSFNEFMDSLFDPEERL